MTEPTSPRPRVQPRVPERAPPVRALAARGAPARAAQATGAQAGGASARVASAVAVPAKPATRRRAQDGRDRQIVGALIIAFVAIIAVIMVVQIRTSGRETESRASMQLTFARVQSRQSEYRTIFGRYATWPELRARGVGVGPRQRVTGWSADRSHWFLALKDTATGVECDRTGELFDEDSGERLPVCRPSR